MYKYLLNVKFCAGSDDINDTDTGLYLLCSKNTISETEMKQFFKEANELLDPYKHESGETDFPISYNEGLNIDTLMNGVQIHTSTHIDKLCTNMGGLTIDNYYEIEQWQ